MTHRGQGLPHPRMSAFALTREERRLRRVSKDEGYPGLMVRDGASAPPHYESEHLPRRRFLKSTAAALSAIAMSDVARAQLATQPPPKHVTPDEFSVAAPVSIEVNARPIPFFDTRDHSRVRFGSLEYRSGLILTSRFRGFGGLSGLRLDTKGERFIFIREKGRWYTRRILST